MRPSLNTTSPPDFDPLLKWYFDNIVWEGRRGKGVDFAIPAPSIGKYPLQGVASQRDGAFERRYPTVPTGNAVLYSQRFLEIHYPFPRYPRTWIDNLFGW